MGPVVGKRQGPPLHNHMSCEANFNTLAPIRSSGVNTILDLGLVHPTHVTKGALGFSIVKPFNNRGEAGLCTHKSKVKRHEVSISCRRAGAGVRHDRALVKAQQSVQVT